MCAAMKHKKYALGMLMALSILSMACKGKAVPANSVRYPVTTEAMQNTRPADVEVNIYEEGEED